MNPQVALLANAGIDQPNPGENFVPVRLVLPLHPQGG
jgi:hypothetical protein